MFDLLDFREHPRPMSSYTEATNLLDHNQGLNSKEKEL
jgi:hypothetical protein